MSFILHAPNIHQGGGLTLLMAILEDLPDNSILFLDIRLPLAKKELLNAKIFWVEPTILGRLRAEWKLRSVAVENTKVLCFGNLPPLFSCKGNVTLFIQNRYCVDKSISLNEFKFRVRIRILIERFWFFSRLKHVKKFVVQTNSMRSILKGNFYKNAKVLPFVPDFNLSKNDGVFNFDEPQFDFVYIASGDPHKNHKNLINAWVELSKSGIYPSLCLTIDKSTYFELFEWIGTTTKEYSLNIKNYGFVKHSKALALYTQSKALIYPSLMESFGLPLVEASGLDMPIIASELDFVRDIVSPIQSFDPSSSTSIARAVRRYLEDPEDFIQLVDGNTFIDSILAVDDLSNG